MRRMIITAIPGPALFVALAAAVWAQVLAGFELPLLAALLAWLMVVSALIGCGAVIWLWLEDRKERNK